MIISVFCTQSTSAQEGSGLVRGPYLQALAIDSVEIIWFTRDVEGVGSVRVFTTAGEGNAMRVEEDPATACNPFLAGETCHRVRLTGLLAGTNYRYEVFAGDTMLAGDAATRFRTTPERQHGVTSFAILGDSGVAQPSQDLVSEIVREIDPDAILHTGDLDYLGDVDKSVFGPYKDLLSRYCFFPARGNHDLSFKFEEIFFVPEIDAMPKRTFYSFNAGSAHFVVLDTSVQETGNLLGDEQLTWLCDDLSSGHGQEWTIVLTHKCFFTIGLHATEATVALRHALSPIFDQFNVDLVISGHDHNYQRTHPVRMNDTRSCGTQAPLNCEATPESCYTTREDVFPGPHYVYPDSPIYLISGGGGQRLYPLHPSAGKPEFDGKFSSFFESAWHTVELEATPAMLKVRGIRIVNPNDRQEGDPFGESFDVFSVSKMRLLRGDMNFDRGLDLADPVALLNSLFLGQSADCLAAGNVNGDEAIDLADAVYLLIHLFDSGPPPSAPYPECGPIRDANAPVLLGEGDVNLCLRNGC